MAFVIVTLKIMPEDPETDLGEIRGRAEKIITEYGGRITGTPEEEPVGFGLKAVILKFSVNEAKGSPDPVAEKIEKVKGVKSVQVTMVSRALG